MNKTSFHILRVGLAITFLWIGILILKDPQAWGGYIAPWVADLLPMPVEQAMMGTAVLDIVVGIFLLVGSFIWIASGVAALHLISVIIVSGINEATVRDIAILAGALALFWDALPKNLADKLKLSQKD